MFVKWFGATSLVIVSALGLGGCAADADDEGEPDDVESEASALSGRPLSIGGERALDLFRAMKSAGIGARTQADGTVVRAAKMLTCGTFVGYGYRNQLYFHTSCRFRVSTGGPIVTLRFEGYHPEVSDLPAVKLSRALGAIRRLTVPDRADYYERSIGNVTCTVDRSERPVDARCTFVDRHAP